MFLTFLLPAAAAADDDDVPALLLLLLFAGQVNKWLQSSSLVGTSHTA
jgi:hypothetical protein